MMASYLLSRTLVPTLVMYLLKNHEHEDKFRVGTGFFAPFKRFQIGFERRFEQLRDAYHRTLRSAMDHRALFITSFLLFCILSMGLVFFLGEDFFPTVDAGIFRMHVRGRAGLRIEETARLCDEVENYVRTKIPKKELVTVLDNIGLPYSSINNSYSTAGSIGTSDAEILFSLNQEKHHPTADYVKQLREELPRRFPGVEFFFQPADIVTQILNFGLPSPIDIQIVGKNQAQNYLLAQDMANQLRHVPGAADVHVQQMINSPALKLNVDRTRAQQVGLQQRDVAQNLLVSLSGSFQTAPTFWLNRENGVTYNVAVQTPEYRVDSLQALMNTPITAAGSSCSAGAWEPGHGNTGSDSGRDFPLQHPTSHGRLCQRSGTRSGRGGAGHAKNRRQFRKETAKRFAHRRARPGCDHDKFLRRAGHWTGNVDRADLLADRGQLPVMA